MLVLTRRPNQSIVIGRDVVITILEVRGDQVRVGIKAPREVTVHREEVYAEIRRENQRASAVRPDDTTFLPKEQGVPKEQGLAKEQGLPKKQDLLKKQDLPKK